jgi:DNA-directed RNA polymerase specialized sigma24 family protein
MSVEVGGGSTGDDRMVKALREAGQHVFAYLYESYAAPLFDYCEGLLGDEVAATDAVQDSLVAVNAKIGALPDPGRLRVALYSEARRQCLAKLPRRGIGTAGSAGAASTAWPVTQQESTAGTEALAADPDTGFVAAVVADMPAIMANAPAVAAAAAGLPGDVVGRTVGTAAMSRLSDRDREVLSLAFRHGIEGADLAVVLGVRPRRARSMLSAAGARFRRAATEVAARQGGAAADLVLGPGVIAAVPFLTPPLTLGLRMTRTAFALGSFRRVAARPAGVPRENVILAPPAPRRGLSHAMVVSTVGLVIIAVPGALLYKFVWSATGRTPVAAQMAGIQSPASAGSSLPSTALDPGGSVRQHRQGPFPGVLGPPPLGVLPLPSPQQSGTAPTPTPPQTTQPGPVPSHSTTPPATTPPPTTPAATTPPPTTPPPTTPPPTTPPPTTPPPTTPPPTTPPPTPTPTPTPTG